MDQDDRAFDKPSSHGCRARVTGAGYRTSGVNPWMLAVAAVALAIERITYAAIWHRPDLFARACRALAPARDPVDVLAALFGIFKVVQVLVFIAWCVAHEGSEVAPVRNLGTIGAGGLLVLTGQTLNLSVFTRLGKTGVFYGNRLGRQVKWQTGFPFSWVRHPQYVGTVLSIWGFFVIARYPAPDWIAVPLLETLYYAIGAMVEQSPVDASVIREFSPSAIAADQREAGRLR